MERRDYLSLLAAATFGTAGCLDALGDRRRASTSSGTDVDLPVPESALHRATERDAIPALVDPAFARDWSGLEVTVASAPFRESVEPRLSPGSPVVGVGSEALASTGRDGGPAEGDGRARAYPLSVLDRHEVVNDRFEPRTKARGTPSDGGPGGPLLVTYCPLCGSGVVAERRVGDRVTPFGVSGLLWRGNLVLYDRATGSLWSQLLGRAIRGPRTGERLRLLPSRLTTWGEWREGHPDTRVLLPPPHSNTVRGPDATFDYTVDSYLSYGTSSTVGRGGTAFEDDRLHPKAPVVGVASEASASTERGESPAEGGGEARAYPLTTVERLRVVNDTVGGRPVVVAVTPDRSLVAYDRRVDDRALRFLPVGRGYARAGGSRWRLATGRAVDGPHEGRRLSPATERSSMFWFAWVKLYPDTEVYRPWDVV